MKLKLKDKIMVAFGHDKGKTGEIMAIFPKKNSVIVSNVSVVKKHLKPSKKNPKGGIVEVTKPINVSKIMAIDPTSGRPARIGYKLNKSGKKERIFKVSRFKNKKIKKSS